MNRDDEDDVTPDRLAVALGFDASNRAPRVIAKGRGYLANAIVDRASAAGVPTSANAELAALLGDLSLDALVPPDLYAVVAQVLAWAYMVDERHRARDGLTGAPAGEGPRR